MSNDGGFMREIKFRAWDIDRRQYLSGGAVFIEVLRGRNPEEGRLYLDTSDHISKDRFILQQYTGLKDKNGAEIYEGDVLEEEEGYYFEVVWDESWAKFKIQHRTISIQYPEWNRGKKMKVIGNIYENPELLDNDGGNE
ncbi:MAG: hypothetical protein IME93_03090 [Proteobacteria bacterium]|nr:hypothetical protein [Pseudomonadota bacterium]